MTLKEPRKRKRGFGGSRIITAEITDHLGVARVTIAYTVGDGQWLVTEMTAIPDSDLFTVSLPDYFNMTYFVPAGDGRIPCYL